MYKSQDLQHAESNPLSIIELGELISFLNGAVMKNVFVSTKTYDLFNDIRDKDISDTAAAIITAAALRANYSTNEKEIREKIFDQVIPFYNNSLHSGTLESMAAIMACNHYIPMKS